MDLNQEAEELLNADPMLARAILTAAYDRIRDSNAEMANAFAALVRVLSHCYVDGSKVGGVVIVNEKDKSRSHMLGVNMTSMEITEIISDLAETMVDWEREDAPDKDRMN